MTKKIDIVRFTPALVIVGAAVLAGAAGGPGRAEGAAVEAASPGAAPARVLFREDFEDAGATPTLITSTGRYVAASAWTSACNGNVIAFSSPSSALASTTCTAKSSAANAQAYDTIRGLARALGTTDPESNHALAGYTDGQDPGPDELLLGMAAPLRLPSATASRFLAVSARSAAVNCDHGGPRYLFALVDGAGHRHVAAPADACTFGGAIAVGTLRSEAVLVPGDTVGLEVRNANGSGTGNDGAIDDLELLDVTPALEQAFSPSTVAPGQPSTLTFTVSNTAEAGAKGGFSVLDALPTGVRLAAVPSFATTCLDADLTAVGVGTTTLQLHGSLAAGQDQCSFSVRVHAMTAGLYVNRPGANLTDAAGVAPSGAASLQVRPALTVQTRVDTVGDIDGNGRTDVGDELTWSFDLTNTSAFRVPTVWIVDDTAGAVICPTGPVLPGRSVRCKAHAPYVVTAADVRRGEVRRVVAARGPGVSSQVVRSVTPLR